MRRALKILGRILSVLLVVVVISLLVLALVVSHDSPCRAAALVPNGAQRMTAAVYRCYGPPAVVKLEEVAKPTPKDNQVLVRVQSASVNPYDWHFMRGAPYFVRLFIGVGAPKDERLGVDFAGTIEAVGQNVKRFKAGDQVFGGADGAFGQYVTVREAGSIAIKPVAVSFEQAAAVPIAGITALQGLRDAGLSRAHDDLVQLPVGLHDLAEGRDRRLEVGVELGHPLGARSFGCQQFQFRDHRAA